ncbi:MAG: hypothetical protein M3Z26_08510 [Bacteroidota bacterium]|nr:hypothetical protein [Bacteroidota bacterium]
MALKLQAGEIVNQFVPGTKNLPGEHIEWFCDYGMIRKLVINQSAKEDVISQNIEISN